MASPFGLNPDATLSAIQAICDDVPRKLGISSPLWGHVILSPRQRLSFAAFLLCNNTA